jgi:hypothetical protein
MDPAILWFKLNFIDLMVFLLAHIIYIVTSFKIQKSRYLIHFIVQIKFYRFNDIYIFTSNIRSHSYP